METGSTHIFNSREADGLTICYMHYTFARIGWTVSVCIDINCLSQATVKL